MAKDYIPRTLDTRDTWLEHFATEIQAVMLANGFVLGDATTLIGKITNSRGKYTLMITAKANAEAATETFKTAQGDTLEAVRSTVAQLKAKPTITNTQLDALQVVAAPTTFDPATAKPIIKLRITGGDVEVETDFPDSSIKSFEITCKRGSETSFTHVAADTNPPYIDNRDNLVGGQPETRKYILWFLDKNGQRMGLQSDEGSITVSA